MKNLLLITAFSIALVCCQRQESGLSPEEFNNPSTEYRPLALWTWMNGYVDTARLVYELEEMKAKGMRGALIWDIGALSDPEKIIPEGPGFLGPGSLEYVSLALDKTHKLDLDLGLVASSSWNAGGEWIGPEDASKQILLTSQVINGPGRKTINIIPPENRSGRVENYSLIASMAIPYSSSKTIDQGLEGAVRLDGTTIEWDVPAGKWEVFSFFSSNTMQNLVCPSPNSSGLIIDHLDRVATQTHFDSLITRLSSISTAENHIEIMMLDSYEVHRMKDWSPKLLEEFKSRYNYDPIPYLPLLLGYDLADTIRAERFRGDYCRLVSDMMIENHFSQSVDIGDKHGFQMLTEAGHGGSPRVDALKALGHSHIPMGEFWNRQRFWVTKEAASAAHIYDRKLVAAESLTGWNNWQHGPSDFKQLIDIAFCEGLNQVVFHTFAHNPEIAGKPGFTYHAGEHINVNTTWWDMAKPFMDYIGRCSYMLRQGLFVADACLYYGDQAPNLVPSKRIDPNIDPIFGDDQCLHCGQPKPVNPGPVPGHDYDYMNAEIIVRDMRVADGKLVLPSGMSYKVMMLPDKEDINLDVLRKLDELVFQGAVILGNKPSRTTSLENYPDCDEEVKSLADKIWGDCDGTSVKSNSYGQGKVYCGLSLQEVLDELGIPKDFEVKGIDNDDMHIDYIHRQTDSEDIYFVSNSNTSVEEFSAVFRVDPDRKPEIWDPMTGDVQVNTQFTITENGVEMDFAMNPLASRFVIFRDGKTIRNFDEPVFGLQFTGKYEQIRTMDISDNWTVTFDQSMGGPGTYGMDKLQSWSDIDQPGIKYYSGTAAYQKSFSIDKKDLGKGRRAILRFDNIQEMARVTVNGKECGILWAPPYEIDITTQLIAGENQLNIDVINTWNNRLVGDVSNPDQKQYTKTNIKNKFRNGNLLDSGIIGDAEIFIIEK